MAEPLLTVEDLVTTFDTDRGVIRPVDEVSFDVGKGETVALVGESGSGKSVTALSLMRLVAEPGRIQSGRVLFQGVDLLTLSERQMRTIRGSQMAMVFQEPMTSLNPVYRVGSQIAEVIRIHRGVKRRAAWQRAVEMLEVVGIPSAELRASAYPHELSGGMRQRVMIAMALACEPTLLIADEPTTALDVTIQAQILDLLAKLQEKLGMGILFITHDLGIVAEFASRVVVMYAGRVVESGAVATTFANPLHPYTRGLLASVPPLDVATSGKPRRLQAIEGVVPSLHALPPGCRFAERCALRRSEPEGYERCDTEEPRLSTADGDRRARCHYAGRAA